MSVSTVLFIVSVFIKSCLNKDQWFLVNVVFMVTCSTLLHWMLPILRRHWRGRLRLAARSAQSWQCLRSLWWEDWLWEERRLETKTGHGTALKLVCLVVSLLRVSSLSTTLARGLRSASLLGSEL